MSDTVLRKYNQNEVLSKFSENEMKKGHLVRISLNSRNYVAFDIPHRLNILKSTVNILIAVIISTLDHQ